KPVRYAIETGRVIYRASSFRLAIQRRRSASGVAVATDLLNARDAYAVGTARRPDLHLVADAVSDQRLAEGRLVAHAAGLGIRLGRSHDAIGLLVLAVLA